MIPEGAMEASKEEKQLRVLPNCSAYERQVARNLFFSGSQQVSSWT